MKLRKIALLISALAPLLGSAQTRPTNQRLSDTAGFEPENLLVQIRD
ncbi:hypothetical protein [Mucilaginibacter sp. OK283]|jgi:hypothetical protein|nr:hypothetical protein [Mucilaginibacter sp. OK283]